MDCGIRQEPKTVLFFKGPSHEDSSFPAKLLIRLFIYFVSLFEMHFISLVFFSPRRSGYLAMVINHIYIELIWDHPRSDPCL